MTTTPPDSFSAGAQALADSPPDPEFDWLVAPLMQALGPQGDSQAIRSAFAASQVRFQQMAGRTDLSTHTRAQLEARRNVEDQGRIARLQQDMASLELDLDTLMDQVVEPIQALVEADGCALELLDDSGELIMRAACGLVQPHIGRKANLAISLSGKSLAHRQVMICDDTEHDEGVDRHMARLIGLRSAIAAPLRSGGKLLGVLVAVYAQPHAFYDRDVGNLQILGESLGVTIDRHRMHEKLRASEAQYRILFERDPHPMFVAEPHTLRIVAANQAATEQYGYTVPELLLMSLRDLQAVPEAEANADAATQAPAGTSKDLRMLHRRKSGEVLDVELSSAAIDIGNGAALLVRCNDVTQRVRAERELARVSRAQRMLSACNESLVRATSEQALLGELCRITVAIGGYSMAWVGFAHEDADYTVERVASVGDKAGYLSSFKLTWSPDDPLGQGPIGRTIRTGRLAIIEDVALDPHTAPWRAHALAHGYRSMVCLPLREHQHTFGLFYLYRSEVAPISQDEVVLLKALADDLAFGLVTLRARERERQAQGAQQRIQKALVKVAATVSASTGNAFFEQMARNMSEALGAQGSFIATLQKDAPWRARALGAVVRGKVRHNMEATLQGCQIMPLLEEGDWIVDLDPNDPLRPCALLTDMGTRVYAGRSLLDGQGRVVGFVLVAFDSPPTQREFLASTLRIFAVRVAAELDRRQADEHSRHQASLLDKARDAIVVSDMSGRIAYWNKSAERLYGWSAEEVMGHAVAALLFDDEEAAEHAYSHLLRSDEWSGDMSRRRKQGMAVLVEARWTLVRDDQGAPQSVLMIDTDITQRKAAEAKIQKLAFYDGLTSLPNRQLLQDRLHKALANSARHGTGGALLCLDLDNFKSLNDTLGHDKGDMLLQQVAMRLVSCVREVDTVARLGGDEFVIVLEELSTVPSDVAVQARNVGEKILAALSRSYRLDGYEHQSTASMGVARFGPDTDSVGELLKQGDIAMYQAKGAGRHTLRFFDPGLQAAVTARAALEADLRQAFVQREFFLQYQPQVDGEDRITGVEALVRWRNPVRGLVSPGEFIPLAEETGMILLLGHRVLEIACKLLASWRHRPEVADLSMAVNVSARQFRHADFVRQVRSVLEQTGANPERLKLELTESVLVDDVQTTVAKMDALRRLGVRFSLDDFGTGYSSLSYLKKLPLDQLKIDQSFVRDVLVDPNDAAIARTIIALAQSLGLGVIAEGVETVEHRDFLAAQGCPAFQGYYFSRPLTDEALEALLLARPPTLAHS